MLGAADSDVGVSERPCTWRTRPHLTLVRAQENRLRPAPLTTDVCRVYLLAVNSSVCTQERF